MARKGTIKRERNKIPTRKVNDFMAAVVECLKNHKGSIKYLVKLLGRTQDAIDTRVNKILARNSKKDGTGEFINQAVYDLFKKKGWLEEESTMEEPVIKWSDFTGGSGGKGRSSLDLDLILGVIKDSTDEKKVDKTN